MLGNPAHRLTSRPSFLFGSGEYTVNCEGREKVAVSGSNAREAAIGHS